MYVNMYVCIAIHISERNNINKSILQKKFVQQLRRTSCDNSYLITMIWIYACKNEFFKAHIREKQCGDT